MRLISFAIYLGIGAMLHALFVGSHFDWSSAWTLGWLFGWPIMLFAATWTFAIGIAVLFGVGWCFWWFLSTYAHWRERRHSRPPVQKR